MSFWLFLIWSRKGCVSKSVLEMPNKGVLFLVNLYLFSCKIEVKISTNILETAQKRGEIFENVLDTAPKRGVILSCGTIMCCTFYEGDNTGE